MGCDIHVCIERKRTDVTTKAVKWINADNWRINPYYGEENESEYDIEPIYDTRDYELFAYLAGVRNYDDTPNLGFDRGFPEDASPHTKKLYKRWGCDAHTPGYATLKELKEKIKTIETVKRKGLVTKEAAKEYKEKGVAPEEWCISIGSDYTETHEYLEWEVKFECFNELIKAIEERKRDVFWIYYEEDDDFSQDDDIRIVFWFDN